MKEIFLKYKTAIFRVTGSAMLLVGFALYFWAAPKEVLSENELAAANVARMEASVSGAAKSSSSKALQPETSKFIEKLKDAQKKQIQYMMILTMILGALFLTYSFISKPKNDSEK